MTTSMSNSWAAGCILWSVLCISYTWRWERVNRAHAEWSTCRLYSLFSSSSFTTYLYLLQESEYSLYAWLYKEETFVHIENRMCIIAFLFCNVIICATSSPLFGKLWNLFSLENVSTWQYIIYTPNYLKTLLNGWCVYIVISDEVIYGRETEGHIYAERFTVIISSTLLTSFERRRVFWMGKVVDNENIEKPSKDQKKPNSSPVLRERKELYVYLL